MKAFTDISLDDLGCVSGGADVQNGVWYQGRDQRNWWQRNAPGFLGGQPEPPRQGVCFDGGALQGIRGNRRFQGPSLNRIEELGRRLPQGGPEQ